MAEQQGIPVSRSRVTEILVNRYLNQIATLQQELAEMAAVNEALMERLRGSSDSETPNRTALSEGINDSQPQTQNP